MCQNHSCKCKRFFAHGGSHKTFSFFPEQWELESWRDRTERDLEQLIDELKECGDEVEAEKTRERKEEWLAECDALIDEVK